MEFIVKSMGIIERYQVAPVGNTDLNYLVEVTVKTDGTISDLNVVNTRSNARVVVDIAPLILKKVVEICDEVGRRRKLYASPGRDLGTRDDKKSNL